MQTAEHNLEAADQQAEAMAKQAKNEAAIMKIMQRISNGDKVPLEDERALMEYETASVEIEVAAETGESFDVSD